MPKNGYIFKTKTSHSWKVLKSNGKHVNFWIRWFQWFQKVLMPNDVFIFLQTKHTRQFEKLTICECVHFETKSNSLAFNQWWFYRLICTQRNKQTVIFFQTINTLRLHIETMEGVSSGDVLRMCTQAVLQELNTPGGSVFLLNHWEHYWACNANARCDTDHWYSAGNLIVLTHTTGNAPQ